MIPSEGLRLKTTENAPPSLVPYFTFSYLASHHHFTVEILKLLAEAQKYYLQTFSVSTRAFILIFDIRYSRFENNGKLTKNFCFYFS